MAYASDARSLLLKAETAYGTAETLAPANAIQCRRIEPNPLMGDWVSRGLISPYGGASPELLVGKHAGVNFDFEAAGSGAAGTRPKWGDALLMCGFAEVVTASTDVTYTPVDADPASATLRARIGAASGIAQTVAGARGSLSFTAQNKQFPFFSVSAVGKYAAPDTGAAPAITPAILAAFKAPVALEPENVPVFGWNGIKLCFTEFSFQDGRRPQSGIYANCDAVDLGARSFTGRMTVEMTEPGVKNLIAESAGGLLQEGIFTFGTVAGNILTITAPNAQLKFAGYQTAGQNRLAASFDLVFARVGSTTDISIKVA